MKDEWRYGKQEIKTQVRSPTIMVMQEIIRAQVK